MLSDGGTICGRAEDILPQLPSGAMILADPPWGINYRSTHNSFYRKPRPGWDAAVRDKDFEPVEGDDQPFDPVPYLRFDKVVLFGANYFADKLPPSRCWIIWDKKLGNPDQAADCEMAWTNFDKPTRIFSHLWRGICRAGEENVSRGPKLHPNQTAIDICRRVIEYSDHRGLIVDTHCGSGSVACAAKDLGLPCISIDCAPKWAFTTALRVGSRQSQLSLEIL